MYVFCNNTLNGLDIMHPHISDIFSYFLEAYPCFFSDPGRIFHSNTIYSVVVYRQIMGNSQQNLTVELADDQ